MKTLHITLATLVAILLQPVLALVTFFPLMGAEFSISNFPPFDLLAVFGLAVMAVSILPILLFGIPCFDALNKTQKLSFLSLSGCAAAMAMLPYLVITYPKPIPGFTANLSWHGHVLPYYDNGQPMAYAWLSYAETALGFGAHGFLCGTVFYLFWRKYRTQEV